MRRAKPRKAAPAPPPVADTQTGMDLERRLAPGTLIAGRYRVVAPLGFGGMGVVYRAVDEELGQDVAVKVLRAELGSDPEWVARFRRELVLAREVTHKNVVRIHDIGESEGLRFLTMRLVEGRSLLDVLTKEGRLPVDRAVHIFRQVAEALQQAHVAGIVHRDIKPANILLGPDDTAYLTDFGVARSLDRDGHTRAGVVPGTLDYLSPEQVAGDPADARSDIYALGILLYEMLTGELPFAQGSRAEVLAQRIAGRPRDIADAPVPVPASVRSIVRRCLQRNPGQRHQTVGEMLADLDAGRAPWRDRLPRALPAAVVAAVLVAGGAGAYWFFARRPGATADLATAAPAGVAILPLVDETGDPSLAWTGAGVAEMLAAHLAETPQLRVIDPSRVLRTMRDLKLDVSADEPTLRQLAEFLEVGHLVTGNIRRAGATVRIDLRLLSGRRAGGIATRTLTAETKDTEGLFRIVGDLGEGLRAEFGTPRPMNKPTPGPQTRSLEAAGAYREGRERLLVGDAVGAAPAFERALAADPNFPAALEALSEAYQALGYHEKAVAAAERAADALGSTETRLGWRVRARLALLRGEPAEAEAAYADLVRRYPNDAQAWFDLAGAQANQGAAAKAVATLERATELDKADARAWLALGRNMILAGDVRKAVTDPLVRALALMTQYGNDQGRGDVVNAMGVGYQRLGEYPQAIARYGEAAAIRAQIGDERGTAVTRKNRASIHLSMGQLAEAEPDLVAARDIYTRIGDRRGLADVWNDFGVLHEARGAYAQARAAYRQALRIRQELGDEQKLAQSYDNVGYVFFLEGEYENALVYWRQALDLHRQTGDKAGVVLTTQNMGFLHTAQGRWSDAMKSFLEALQLAREIDFKNAVAVSQGNIGLLQQYDGRYAAALSAYQEALGVVQALGDKRGLAEYTLRVAAALIEVGQLDQAKVKLDAAAAWVRETGNREQNADQQTLLGEWHLARHEPAAARRSLGRAVELAEASRSRGAILRAKIARGNALVAGGDAGAAARDLSASLREADALGDALLRIRAAEALASAELGRGRAAAAAELAQRAVKAAERSGWNAGLHRLQALLGRALEQQGDAPGSAAAYSESARSLSRVREAVPAELRSSFDAAHPVRDAATRPAASPVPR
jgi:tetratricopeptide (TPR) repeat protein/TolB-like protein